MILGSRKCGVDSRASGVRPIEKQALGVYRSSAFKHWHKQGSRQAADNSEAMDCRKDIPALVPTLLALSLRL